MFSDILAKLMKERNITQKQLVSDLEIGKNQVAYWKKNDAVPNKTTLKAIAAYFDVSVDYLLGKEPTDSGVGEEKSALSAVSDKEDALNKELISRLVQLTPAELEKVDAFVQGLLASR